MPNNLPMENKTMTTIEHLNKIKAKCEQLLTIAEKRTPGEWQWDGNPWDVSNNYRSQEAPWLVCKKPKVMSPSIVSGDIVCMEQNAIFIASCAGPAEAGWRSTIAAINDILTVDQDLTPEVQKITIDMLLTVNGKLVESVLSAWPEELLN